MVRFKHNQMLYPTMIRYAIKGTDIKIMHMVIRARNTYCETFEITHQYIFNRVFNVISSCFFFRGKHPYSIYIFVL